MKSLRAFLAIAVVGGICLFLAGCRPETEPNNTLQQAQASGNNIGSDEIDYNGSLPNNDTDVWTMSTSGSGSMTFTFWVNPGTSYHAAFKRGTSTVVSVGLSCPASSSKTPCMPPVTFDASAGDFSLELSGTSPFYGFRVSTPPGGASEIVIIGRTSDPPSQVH